MICKKNKKRFFEFSLFMLFILILFHGINNYIWLRLNQRPPVDDEAIHLLSCLQYLDIIAHPFSNTFLKIFSIDNFYYLDIIAHPFSNTFLKIVSIDNFYPPLFPLVAAFLGLIFGKNITVLAMTNFLFLSGIFVCLYFIGVKAGNKRLGVLAACLLSLFPMFFHLTRIFFLEIALCFMVVISITLLIYSEGFIKLDFSLLFGIFLGLGLLTKQYYIIFITGPLVFLLIFSFKNENSQIRKKIVVNLFLSLLVGICIAVLWYLPNFKEMFQTLMFAAFHRNAVPPDITTCYLKSIPFYLYSLINEQILLFFSLIFAVSFIFIFQKKRDKFFLLFIIWIIFPFLVFTLFKNKYWYYTLAYLPAASYICAYGIMSIKKEFLKIVVILLILFIGIFQFFMLSYVNYRGINIRIGDIKILPWPMMGIFPGDTYYPREGDWKVNVLISRILKEHNSKIAPIVGIYRVDPNIMRRIDPAGAIDGSDSYISTNPHTLALAYRLKFKNVFFKFFVFDGLSANKIDKKIDFIISPITFKNIKINEIKMEDYAIIEEFVMPDTSKVYLYKIKQ